MKHQMVYAVAALAIGGTMIWGVTQVHAQGTNGQTLAQTIAQKFNLDTNQVQQVIDQYRTNNQSQKLQNLEQKVSDHLDQLVQQGKITSAQKTAIENEVNTLKDKYNFSGFSSMNTQERKQAIQSAISDFKTWAQSQGINLSHLGINPLFGMGMMHRWKGNPTPSSSPSPS